MTVSQADGPTHRRHKISHAESPLPWLFAQRANRSHDKHIMCGSMLWLIAGNWTLQVGPEVVPDHQQLGEDWLPVLDNSGSAMTIG